MNKSLKRMAIEHGTVWAIYVPAGQLLLKQLAAKNPDAHAEEAKEVLEANTREVQARAGDMGEKPYEMRDGIAVISLSGTMTKNPTSFGGASTALLRRSVRMAAADPEVDAILLVVDSPGGSVSGTADFASDVYAAGQKKNLVAYIQDNGCSAAYWAASQASGGVFANDTALVGSIGTVMVLYDESKAYDDLGVQAKVYSTGPYKGAGAEGAPITEEQDAAFQQLVDDLNAHFLASVARGRNMNMAKVKALADGNIHVGSAAVTNGLIDGVASMDQVLASMRRSAALARGEQAQGPDNNDFRSNEALYVGATFEQRLNSVCVAVEGAISEGDKVHALRAPQNRTLGNASLRQMQALHARLGELIERCEAFRDCSASEKSAAEPTTIPDQGEALKVLARVYATRAKSLGVQL